MRFRNYCKFSCTSGSVCSRAFYNLLVKSVLLMCYVRTLWGRQYPNLACFHSKIYSEVPPLTFYFITKHTNRGLKNNVWDMISAKIHISELCHWKLHFMNFSYAIMIFNIMIFEFHSAWNSHYWIFIRRETVIIEMVIRHGTLKNQNSSSGLAGKSHGKL
jgi:hypothetical protein